MYGLTKKQKRLIEEEVKQNGISDNFNIFVWKVLEPINDYEVLNQDARRYAEDFDLKYDRLPF